MIKTFLIDSHEVIFKVDNLPELAIPASIAALRVEGLPNIIQQGEWEKYAIEIIQKAILWLIALKRIRVFKVSLGRSILSLQFQTFSSYILLEGTKEPTDYGGWLESEILKSIALGNTSRESEPTFSGAFIESPEKR